MKNTTEVVKASSSTLSFVSSNGHISPSVAPTLLINKVTRRFLALIKSGMFDASESLLKSATTGSIRLAGYLDLNSSTVDANLVEFRPLMIRLNPFASRTSAVLGVYQQIVIESSILSS